MRPRALYIPLFVVFVASGRFMALILRDSLALSDTQVGWILGMSVLGGVLGTPLWTARADRVSCERVLSEQLVVNWFLSSLLAVAVLIQDQNGRFVFALCVRMMASFVFNSAGSVMDALSLKQLHDRDRYGEERLWGAISWGIVSLLSGFAMDYSGNDVVEQYMPLIVSCLLLAGGTIANLVLLRVWSLQIKHVAVAGEETMEATPLEDGSQRVPPPPSNPAEIPVVPLTMFGFLRKYGSVRLYTFLFTAAVMGAAMSLVENLLFLFLRNDLHASYALCGVSVLITVSFEIPIFAYGKRLLNRIGMIRLILGGMTAYVIRVTVYTLVTSSWAILIVEPLHGVTYAFIQTAFVAYMTQICPHKSNFAIGQGLMGFWRDMGRLMGTVCGGYVLDLFGASIMYRGAALTVTLNVILVWFILKDVGGGDDNNSSHDDHVRIGMTQVSQLDEDGITDVVVVGKQDLVVE